MENERRGILERLSWKSVIVAIITVLGFYFGVPAYFFDARPNFVANLGSGFVSFIEGAILGAITVLLVLKIYSQISSEPKEEKTKRHISKTYRFEGILHPSEEKTFLEVESDGSFQRLEIQAQGNPKSRMILEVDDNICWNESFEEMMQKASGYLRVYKRPSPQADATCAVEFELQRSFSRNLRFSVKNVDANSNLGIEGTVYFSINETI